MEKYADFTKVIEDYISLFEELIPLEQTKLDAAVKNRVTFVEESTNKEQALLMKMRGLEQRREDVQKKMGIENYTFKEILDKAEADDIEPLELLFNRLAERVTSFKSVNDAARDAIETNLYNIQKAMAAEGATYNAAGSKSVTPKSSKPFTSRSV